jgi:hypothetical protein
MADEVLYKEWDEMRCRAEKAEADNARWQKLSCEQMLDQHKLEKEKLLLEARNVELVEVARKALPYLDTHAGMMPTTMARDCTMRVYKEIYDTLHSGNGSAIQDVIEAARELLGCCDAVCHERQVVDPHAMRRTRQALDRLGGGDG